MDNPRFLIFLLICLFMLQIYLSIVAPRQPEEEVPGTTPQVTEVVPVDRPRATNEDTVTFPDREPLVIETSVARIEIDVEGARPVRWEITDPQFDNLDDDDDGNGEINGHDQYPQIIPQPPAAARIQTAELPLQVELARIGSTDIGFNHAIWRVSQEPTRNPDGSIEVAFESPVRDGLSLEKRFVFHDPQLDEDGRPVLEDNAGGFMADFTLTIRNQGEERVVLDDDGVGLSVTWGPGIGEFERSSFYNMRQPIALVDDDMWYKAPSERKPRQIATTNPNGVSWAGLQSRYFLAVLIPTGDTPPINQVRAELRSENEPRAEEFGRYTPLQTALLDHPTMNLTPGQEVNFTYQMYVGPNHRPHLLAAEHELGRANFYSSWSWMRGLCIMMTKILRIFHGMVGNYGWAILMLTVMIRLLMYPLTHKQMRIMAKSGQEMKRIKPYLQEVREKYKNDFQKMQRETMAVYKEHGVNPYAGLKGCLPMLIQMPFLFALFIMLRSLVELRGADWLWIDDLSGPDQLLMLPWLESIPLVGWIFGDSLNVLPLLMAGTQIMMMRLSPTRTDDPSQKMMMTMMPIMMTLMLYRAPSGLMLYWVAGNIWQMGHQSLTNRAVLHEQDSPEGTDPGSGGSSSGGRPSDRGIGKAKEESGDTKGKRGKSRASLIAEKRKEAAEARRRSVSESKSLPRWMRRGGA